MPHYRVDYRNKPGAEQGKLTHYVVATSARDAIAIVEKVEEDLEKIIRLELVSDDHPLGAGG